MFGIFNRKRHYALLLATESGLTLYQVFDDGGYVIDAFPAKMFKQKQEQHNRLTVLFDGAYIITEYQFKRMLARYGWIQIEN